MALKEFSNSAGTYDGTELVLYPGYPEFDRADGARSVTYKYWCKTSLAHDGTGGLIPLRFSSISFNGVTYYLADAKATEQSSPGKSDVTLMYNATGSKQEPIRSDGDVERRIEPIVLTRPKVEAISVGDEDKAEQSIWGLEYEYETTKANFLWSEENLIKSFADKIPMTQGVPTGDSPPGITGIDDPLKWLFSSMRLRETPRQEDGTGGYTPAMTTITEKWFFSPLGWQEFEVPE